MTVFITHCWKSLWRRIERRFLLALVLASMAAQALAGAEMEQFRVEKQDGGLMVHAHLRLELGTVVEDALLKGVPVHFVAEAELMRDRWYWYDRKLTQVSRFYRLSYQPLTRQWRVQVSREPMAVGGSGISIAQSFDNLQSALDVIRLQSGWKLAELSDVDPEARQYVVYRFRLDISQLPRPFQIAAGSQSGWSMSLGHSLRIPPETRN